MMLKRMVMAAAALGALAACAAEWAVSEVRARQRRPWSTCVDVDFLASCPSGGCCSFGLVVSNGNEEVSVSSASLVGGEGLAIGDGYVRITWDPSVDHPGQSFPQARYYPVAKPCDAPPYLVVDLVTGARSFRGYDFAEKVNVDEYKLDKLVCRYVPATTSDAWKALSGGQDTFLMGLEDSFSDAGNTTGVQGLQWAKSRHPVRLTRGYYLGVFEVTQQQWKHVWGSWTRQGWFTNVQDRATRPIEFVDYTSIRGSNAQANWPKDGHEVYCNTFFGVLRHRTGLTFDLPTEAQWEYACRAGTTGLRYASDYNAISRHWGNSSGKGYSASQMTDAAYRAEVTVEKGGTAKVGSYLPNAWGFYDMLGNVQEFCLDASNNVEAGVPYPPDLQVDPVGASFTDPWRILRGGCWWQYANRSVAPWRGLDGWKANQWTGFRVCLDAGEVLK